MKRLFKGLSLMIISLMFVGCEASSIIPDAAEQEAEQGQGKEQEQQGQSQGQGQVQEEIHRLVKQTMYDASGKEIGKFEYTYTATGYSYVYYVSGDPYMKSDCEESGLTTTSKSYAYKDGAWVLSSSSETTYADAARTKVKLTETYDASGKMLSKLEYTYTATGYSYVYYISGDPYMKSECEESGLTSTSKSYSYKDGGWVLSSSSKSTYTDAARTKVKLTETYDASGKMVSKLEYTYTATGYSYVYYVSGDPYMKFEHEESGLTATSKSYAYKDGGWVLSSWSEYEYEIVK